VQTELIRAYCITNLTYRVHQRKSNKSRLTFILLYATLLGRLLAYSMQKLMAVM